MTIAHIGALKAATAGLSVVALAAFALDPTVQVAIIGAIPATITAFMWGWANHKKISAVESNTNGKLSQLLEQKDAATTRADRAEGHIEGALTERDKTP